VIFGYCKAPLRRISFSTCLLIQATISSNPSGILLGVSLPDTGGVSGPTGVIGSGTGSLSNPYGPKKKASQSLKLSTRSGTTELILMIVSSTGCSS